MKRNLTKCEIIRKKDEIDRIFKNGKTFYAEILKLICLPSMFGYDRIIVIPAKHFGRAVDRNLVRRRVKEIFRNYSLRVSSLEPKENGGMDYAVVLYPGKVSNFSLLKMNFEHLLDKSKKDIFSSSF